MKTKNQWELIDILWDSFLNTRSDDKSLVGKTIKSWSLDTLFPYSCEYDWEKKIAIDRFCFELRYCFQKPIRDTMKWIDGDHVMLYDRYACKKHRLVITTHDDSGYIPNASVFCPECNKDNMWYGKIKERNGAYPLEWEVIKNDDDWKALMKWSKIRKKFNKKSNRRHKLSNFLFKFGIKFDYIDGFKKKH